MSGPLLDRDERDRIRTSLDESLIVEAAAGTGKTTELVHRLLNILAEGRGTVQTVAVLTFTDKAAGELKLRLRSGLEEERRNAPLTSARRVNLERALGQLEEARISTIHGFCKDLLQERPVEARVDPQLQVLAEEEAEQLYGQAFDRWLQAKLEDPPEGLRRALRRRSADDGNLTQRERLRRAGWDLTRWRDLRAPWARKTFGREAAIGALIERVHEVADELTKCSNTSDRLYRDMWRVRRLSSDTRLAEQVRERDHDGLEGALVEVSGDRYFRRPSRGSPRSYGGAANHARILAVHGELVSQLEGFSRCANADLAALLQQELLETVSRYEELKAGSGALDFFDLLLKARDLVRDQRDVRVHYQQRFTHILIDEFQDTDPLQSEILLLLASSDPSVNRWRDVTPVPGKLFIVGDPKQSIYRFRRADVGTYQEVKARLRERGVACLELRTSFRSVSAIQRFVNAAFMPVMRDDSRTSQAAYVALARHREDLPGQPAVVALPVPRPYGKWNLTKGAVEASLPDAVGAFVEWLLNQSGWKVTERDRPGETVAIAPRHICLLFRRFSSWGTDVTSLYTEALEARQIPHLLVGGKSFYVREEVESLRTALSAIEWPDDELAIYATLKGPLFAIGDEDLLEYRHRFRRLHPYRVPKDEGASRPAHLETVAQSLLLLRDLHRARNYCPVEETIAKLLAATRAHAGFVLRPWGEQALANVSRITDLARKYEASGGISFRGFVDRLRGGSEGEAPEAPILEEGSEGIRLMTVHRAKGLEFPVVILADITANIAPGHPSRHVDVERELCAQRLAGCAPWDLLDNEAEEIARERAEGERVAYVAATRARDLLVVPAIGDDPFFSGWDAADDGWISPVQGALYPAAAARRVAGVAPGCPEFGDDSVLERAEQSAQGPHTVHPGWHAFGTSPEESYGVVWWDPGCLTLDVKPLLGLRRQELIEDAGGDVVERALQQYQEWRTERHAAITQGGEPSIVVESVTDWIKRQPRSQAVVEATAVEAIDRAPAALGPAGARFGSLVHAVLATIPLDATGEAVVEATSLQARILGAAPEEATSAAMIVEAALAHPLLQRARDAWHRGQCRREMPIGWVDDTGTLVEGVLDLAFEEGDRWTVVDFKTGVEGPTALEHYRRQVGLYAAMVGKATGRTAQGILLRL